MISAFDSYYLPNIKCYLSGHKSESLEVYSTVKTHIRGRGASDSQLIYMWLVICSLLTRGGQLRDLDVRLGRMKLGEGTKFRTQDLLLYRFLFF